MYISFLNLKNWYLDRIFTAILYCKNTIKALKKIIELQKLQKRRKAWGGQAG